MPQIIQHRINNKAGLENVPLHYGVEIDIRYHENDLVLHHDAFHHHEDPRPEKLDDYLTGWKHQGPLILNTKTEGIEKQCIELMVKHKVPNWFFLDLSMPYFCIFAEHAVNGTFAGFTPDNLAVRYSEREPIEYALSFKGKIKWVWVDCFTRLPLDAEAHRRLKDAGLKICLVAPELQKHAPERAAEFKAQLAGLPFDAVCTKRPDLWL